MRRLLRFRDIEYFIAVAEQRSFAKAADVLGVTQPTLSNQIRKIEETLECKLFERSSREVTLTPEGQLALEHGRVVMRAFYDLDDAMRGEGAFLGRRLRFGVIPTVSPYLGPGLLEQVRRRNPEGGVSFVEGLTADLERMVAVGELDFAVTATLPADKSLSDVRLGPEQLVYVGRGPVEDDPFAPGAEQGRPLILMQEGHCFREAVYAAIARRNALMLERVSYSIAPASLATLASLAVSGAGDAVAPAPFVAAHREWFGGLEVRRLDPDLFQRSLHLVVRSARAKHAETERLAAMASALHAEITKELAI